MGSKALKIVVAVLFVISLSCGIYGYIRHNEFSKQNNQSDNIIKKEQNNEEPQENNEEPKEPQENNEEKELNVVSNILCKEYDDTSVKNNIGLLTHNKIDNFSSLDYSNITQVDDAIGDAVFKIDNGIVSVSGYDDFCSLPSYEFKYIKNAKSMRIACDCGGCRNLFVLSDDNTLYNILLDHGCIEEDYEKDALNHPIKDISSIALSDYVEYNTTTCGGYDLFVKKTDKSTKMLELNRDDDLNDISKLIEFDQYERKYINLGNFSIYGVYVYEQSNRSNATKPIEFIKNENGNEIFAKEWNMVYLLECNENRKDEDKLETLFIVDENNRLFYYDDMSTTTAKLYTDKKVKNINKKSEKITYTFTDNTNLTLEYNNEE